MKTDTFGFTGKLGDYQLYAKVKFLMNVNFILSWFRGIARKVTPSFATCHESSTNSTKLCKMFTSLKIRHFHNGNISHLHK